MSADSISYNLYSLKVFATVARLRGLTRAAAELGISQPAVSAQIKALEERFGDRLLQRGGKETRLTALGEAVHAQTLAIFAELEELEALARGAGRRPLTLGASYTPGTFWLPGVLRNLRRDCGLECDYRIGDSRQVRDWVLEGSLPLGLVGAAPDGQLEHHEVGRDRLCLMGRRGHHLNLQDDTLLMRAPGSATRAFSESLLLQLGPFRRRLQLNSGEAIKEAVLAGMGVAVLSSWSVRRETEAGLLTALGPPELVRERPIYLIRRPGSLRGQAARVWDYLAGTNVIPHLGHLPGLEE